MFRAIKAAVKRLKGGTHPHILPIDKEAASLILGSNTEGGGKYTPTGKFYYQDGELWVGIDNSTGHAWTEEFDSVDQCKRWLMGERLESVKGGSSSC